MENSQISDKILKMVKRYSNLKMVWNLEKNSGESVTTHVDETLHYFI